MAGLDVRDFGAVGDGEADDSSALRTALVTAAEDGGRLVRIPAGIYRTGPLRLGSGTELHLERGAAISFIPDFSLYGPVRTRWEGVECWAMHPLLFASGASMVALSGEGTLDGNGEAWWRAFRAIRGSGRASPETSWERSLAALNGDFSAAPSGGGGRETQFLRPPLVQFLDCEGVRVEGVRLRNSPFWNTHLVYCRGISIRAVLFSNPHDAPNTDGLNLDSCSGVIVEDCEFDVGDDCLGLKSGSGEDGLRLGRPTERVEIRRCLMRGGHGGVVIGSETAGGVRDVAIKDCRFIGTDRGLRIKTRRGRGGIVEKVSLVGCEMEGTLCPVVLNCYYGPGGPPEDDQVFSAEAQPLGPTTPRVRDIRIEGLKAIGCRAAAAFAAGLPESPIEGLSIIDSSFSLDPSSVVPPEEAAMSRGLPPPEGRGFRFVNVRSPLIRDVDAPFSACANVEPAPE